MNIQRNRDNNVTRRCIIHKITFNYVWMIMKKKTNNKSFENTKLQLQYYNKIFIHDHIDICIFMLLKLYSRIYGV